MFRAQCFNRYCKLSSLSAQNKHVVYIIWSARFQAKHIFVQIKAHANIFLLLVVSFNKFFFLHVVDSVCSRFNDVMRVEHTIISAFFSSSFRKRFWFGFITISFQSFCKSFLLPSIFAKSHRFFSATLTSFYWILVRW